MNDLQILTYPHVYLAEKSRPMGWPLVPRDVERVEWMKAKVREEGNLGLAAIQIGWNRKVIVINLKACGEEGDVGVFLNPTVEYPYGCEHLEMAEESCLSLPGFSIVVSRPWKCKASWKDGETGMPREALLHGLLARVFQHETDHLRGLLINRFVPIPQPPVQ